MLSAATDANTTAADRRSAPAVSQIWQKYPQPMLVVHQEQPKLLRE
jgi:hypothetical protein